MRGNGQAAGDPDWVEISARSQRLFDDALGLHTVAQAPFCEISDALLWVAQSEAEAVAQLELLLLRLRRSGAPSPSLAQGVGEQARRVQLVFLAQKLIRAMAAHETTIRSIFLPLPVPPPECTVNRQYGT